MYDQHAKIASTPIATTGSSRLSLKNDTAEAMNSSFNMSFASMATNEGIKCHRRTTSVEIIDMEVLTSTMRTGATISNGLPDDASDVVVKDDLSGENSGGKKLSSLNSTTTLETVQFKTADGSILTTVLPSLEKWEHPLNDDDEPYPEERSEEESGIKKSTDEIQVNKPVPAPGVKKSSWAHAALESLSSEERIECPTNKNPATLAPLEPPLQTATSLDTLFALQNEECGEGVMTANHFTIECDGGDGE